MRKRNTMTVEENGHTYRIVPIEGSNDYSVVKDNRTTKRISHDELFVGDDIIDIENWFNIA